MAVIWGIPYFFFKIAVGGLYLASLVFLRTAYCIAILSLLAASQTDLALRFLAASLGVTALAYAPFGLAQLPVALPSASVVVAVAVLGVACTALGFVLFFALVAEVGAPRATVITYVNPAVALALGVTLLGQQFTPGIAIGFVLIVFGSILATRRAPPSTSESLTQERARPVRSSQ